MQFTVEHEKNKAVVDISETGLVLMRFFWNNAPQRSKKGNLNMAWCPRELFEMIIHEYTKHMGKEEDDF
jgi:hypothetical protein